MQVVQVGAYWIESKPKGRGMGNLSLPEKETLLLEPEKAEAVDEPAEATKNSAATEADKGGKDNAADADSNEAQAEHG